MAPRCQDRAIKKCRMLNVEFINCKEENDEEMFIIIWAVKKSL